MAARRKTALTKEQQLRIAHNRAARQEGVTLSEIQDACECSHSRASILVYELQLETLGKRQGDRGRPATVYGLPGAPIPRDLSQCPHCGQDLPEQ